MAVCQFEGNSDMYGLGIRLGFYLQWFGVIFATWIAPDEVPGFRFGNGLFVAATFLALVIQESRDVNALQVVEVYIILLLMFGAYVYIVPVYIWRLFKKCSPYWDPTRYPRVDPGPVTANLGLLLEFAVLGLQFWFWFARVQDLKSESCEQYGFFFAKIRLDNAGFVVVNLLIYFMLAIVCLVLVFAKWVKMLGYLKELNENDERNSEYDQRRIQLLRNLDSIIKLFVASIITAATELTIQWNHIDGVNSLAAAGQTIPFVIGLGAVIRIFYVYFFYDENGNPPYRHEKSSNGSPIPWDRPPTAAAPIPWDQAPVYYGRPPPRSRPGPRIVHERETNPSTRRRARSAHDSREERRRPRRNSTTIIERGDAVELDWERQGWVRRHSKR